MFMRLISLALAGRCPLMDLPADSLFPRPRSLRLGIQPATDWINFKARFGAGAILLGGGLAGLFALQFPAFAGSALVGLALAVQADQDGEGPVFVGCEGQGDL